MRCSQFIRDNSPLLQLWVIKVQRQSGSQTASRLKLQRLWNHSKDPSGNWIKTCSILTTTPNAVTSGVHDRMPVILDSDSYDLWLDP
jgi:putative SOS response-associated peptidase YedK